MTRHAGDDHKWSVRSAGVYGEKPLLVCATFPILGTNNIVELYRNPDRKVLGGNWICCLTEHVIKEDSSLMGTVKRGTKEELGYNPLQRSITELRSSFDLSYTSPEGRLFRWNTRLFVIPIRNIKQLNPDGKEILDLRERPINEVFEEARQRDSFYQRFKPKSFMEEIEGYTQKVMSEHENKTD